jgi:hypothetical protein
VNADLTIVIPTQGRETLPTCLASMRPLRQGDVPAQILVVADTHSPLLMDVQALCQEERVTYLELDAGWHDWGYPQLQYGYDLALGDYVMNIGDDDVYEPGAFEVIRNAIDELPSTRPLLFRALMHPSVSRPCGDPLLLWRLRGQIVRGTVTGQNLVAPNVPAKLGTWVDDFIHLEQTVNAWDGLVEWRDEVIAKCY